MCTVIHKIISPIPACRNFILGRIGSYVSRRMSHARWDVSEEVVHTTKGGVQYIVHSLTHEELPKLVSFQRDRSSAMVVSCVHSWLNKDPNGILIAVTSTGEFAGSISNVLNNDDDDRGICFAGMFYVPPKYQGQGIGITLWTSIYSEINNTGCNAVREKLELYQNCGLIVHETRFTSLEYHTTSWPLDFTSFPDVPPPGVDIQPLDESHLPAIFDYDENLVGFRRTTAMRLNLFEDGSRTLVAVGGGGTVVGFGTVKVTCFGAVRVGPLYADDPKVAEVLLKRLAGLHEDSNGFVFMAISANSVAKEWMDRLGVKVRIEYDRLYMKKLLDVDISKIYSQFDFMFAPF